MKRRTFLSYALASASLSTLPSFLNLSTAQAATTLTKANAIAALKAAVITPTALTNPATSTVRDYSGALMLAPYGMLNWYFANLALLFAFDQLTDADAFPLVKNHLNSYLRNLTSNKIILDAEFPTWNYTTGQPTSWQTPQRDRDSDDAYAATFVALAARFVTRFSKNTSTYKTETDTWWNTNKATVKSVAYLNLLVPLKSNGLTPTFRPDLPIPNHIQQNPYYSTATEKWAACQVGYLMDNCEVHYGLKQLVTLLQAKADSEASYFNSFISIIAGGISSLYHTGSSAYRDSDAATAVSTGFYPGATCQIYPTVFQVTTELTPTRMTAAWAYFSSHASNWSTWPNNGTGLNNTPDVYPWAVIAYGTGKTTNTSLKTQGTQLVRKIESNFALTNQRPYITINELGFYLAALLALNLV